jgi:hypothetical protein
MTAALRLMLVLTVVDVVETTLAFRANDGRRKAWKERQQLGRSVPWPSGGLRHPVRKTTGRLTVARS